MFLQEEKSIKRAVIRLKNIMGNNLLSVIAFGSRVRGDFTWGSDFDILVIVRRKTLQTVRAVNNIFYAEQEKSGTPYSTVVEDYGTFTKSKRLQTGFALNIEKEGVYFYDRTNAGK